MAFWGSDQPKDLQIYSVFFVLLLDNIVCWELVIFWEFNLLKTVAGFGEVYWSSEISLLIFLTWNNGWERGSTGKFKTYEVWNSIRPGVLEATLEQADLGIEDYSQTCHDCLDDSAWEIANLRQIEKMGSAEIRKHKTYLLRMSFFKFCMAIYFVEMWHSEECWRLGTRIG